MKILICPLNWGLGHATRCVPLIRKFMTENHEVVIASDGYPLQFLQQQFPELQFICFPSYKIAYSTGRSQIFAMLKNIPHIITGIFREHFLLKRMLKSACFDQVISDNRFGLWTKKVHSTYITHQLMIKMPRGLKWLEPIAWLLHRFFITRYDECLIPDYEGENNLSADLSHHYPLPRNARFIGPLSRFEGMKTTPVNQFEVVALISGVEPQRSIFEKYLIERFKDEEFKTLIVCGLPQPETEIKHLNNITLMSHLEDEKMTGFLTGAKRIIARSGYSTIMDLNALNCIQKAEFIPTPGQTEQEYLFTVRNTK